MFEAKLQGLFEDEFGWEAANRDILPAQYSFPVLEEDRDNSKNRLIKRMKDRIGEFDEQLDEHIAGLNLKIKQMRRHIAGHSYMGASFTNEQYDELLRAKEFGVDPAIIADPEYDPEQMRTVAEAAGAGYDISSYNPSMDIHKLTLLNTFQMLAPEYDVVRLANIPADKIKVILKGYMEGIDILNYAVDYSADQLEEILLCREKGLDISKILDNNLSADQMNILIEHMDLGIDVSSYNNPSYSVEQMDSAAYEQLENRSERFMGIITKEDDKNNPNIVDKARHSVYLKSCKYYNPEHNNRVDREEAALRMYQGMKLQSALVEREAAFVQRQEAVKEKRGMSI